MTKRWTAHQMRGIGEVIADLPNIEPQWPLRRTIGAYDTGSVTMFIDSRSPTNWRRAVKPGATWLICRDDATTASADTVVWAGYITERSRDYTTNQIAISLTSPEGYLDRLLTGDVTYPAGTKRSHIVTTLLAISTDVRYFPLMVGTSDPALTEDLILQRTDNATILSRLTQVFAQLGGQFAVKCELSLEGLDGPVIMEFLYGTKIGVRKTGASAGVTLEQPGALVGLVETISYSADKGANHVSAYSTSQDGVTPYSPVEIYSVDPDVVRFDLAYSPGSDLSGAQLAQYANQTKAITGPGGVSYTLTAQNEYGTHREFGVDYDLGDDIDFLVHSVDTQGRQVFDSDERGGGQMVAVEIYEDTIVPMLADGASYVLAGDGS